MPLHLHSSCALDDVPRLAFLAGRGDAGALDTLARRVQPVLEAHARRALGRQSRDGLDVDDLVEEVVADVQAFLVAGEEGPGWRRFESSRARGEIEGWLFGIVRNKVRRCLRDRRRRQALEPEPAEEASSDAPGPDRALDAARALELVRLLPARERSVVALWLLDTPSREIATALRFASPHAVDCCLNRGKQRLRRMLLSGVQRAAA
ncbi:MAG TPA: sigma-70 family RNA polymerase sigma factor [Anaeromyxobacteraceae bacterium]|nr:sigma-70 family RNA polymerase sigma factor [Anaeromyxobacteraceae bacterium]